MTYRPTQLERAYELARSGTCQSNSDIVAALKRERYSVDQICGPRLMKDLRELCRAHYVVSDVAVA